jgi:MoxR-like ATPase
VQWGVYRGDGEPHPFEMPPAPPWRQFARADGRLLPPPPPDREASVLRAATYRPDAETVQMVNTALYLRRPLLVTGRPGTGKSSLAYHVAHELGLGRVLTWPITSRSTLADGLYSYDPIGRLHDANLARSDQHDSPSDIGRYVRLGPLGTALLPWSRPRVLLIDEFDKSDVDLPNDLLNVFEEGEFDVPPLARLPEQRQISVMTDDRGTAEVRDGLVRCVEFPFVVITSNGERELPPALLRRCIRLELRPPDSAQLSSIVAAHLGDANLGDRQELIEAFLRRRTTGELATDQLLNAVFLSTQGLQGTGAAQEVLARLFTPLNDVR